MAGQKVNVTVGSPERFVGNHLSQVAPDALIVRPAVYDPTQGRRFLFVEGIAREFSPSPELQRLISDEQMAWDRVRTLQHAAGHKEDDAVAAERRASQDRRDVEIWESKRDRYKYSTSFLDKSEYDRLDRSVWIAGQRADESLAEAKRLRAEARAAWDRVSDARTLAEEASFARNAREAEERAEFAEQQAARDQDNIV